METGHKGVDFDQSVLMPLGAVWSLLATEPAG
jgi:hypothetical protein